MSERIPPVILQNDSDAAIGYEMAYQIRVATDEIRFAIQASETWSASPAVMLEARMQLLDALERLQSAERHFQKISRNNINGY